MSVVHPVGVTVAIEVFWNNSIWSDITDDVRYWTMQSSQRSRLANTWDGGRLVFQVDNRTRKYDPLNSAGTYFGNLKPGRLARVKLNGAEVWRGKVDRFQIDYDKSNKDSVATISCLDSLGLAATVFVPAGTTPGLTTGENITARGAQISAVATEGVNTGWPSWANNAVDYVAECSGQDEWNAGQDHNLLDEVRKMADLEQAPAFASPSSNEILLHPRHWFKLYSESNTIQTTIGTGGLPFHDIAVLFDADEIITAVSMVSSAGDAVVAIDTAGESEYGTRYPSVSYTDIPASNDEQLEGAANTVIGLRATEEFRIDSLVIKPGGDASWPAEVSGLKLLSRVTVVYTPTLTGSAISADYFIDGITHEVSPGDWTTTYSLMPANRFDEAIPDDLFIIGTSLVDGTNLVGF